MNETPKKKTKLIKKFKYKRPTNQKKNIQPGVQTPESSTPKTPFNENLEELNFENLEKQVAKTPSSNTSSREDDDEFERLLNEFISAEIDDVNDEVERVQNGEEPQNNIVLPMGNSDQENISELEEGERSLYRAYQNYFYAIQAIQQNNALPMSFPSIEAKNLFPHFKLKIGKKISQDILTGWDTMLKVYPQELSTIKADSSDNELLDVAEKASDANLQLALISYVEILIEIEGCELNYAERKLTAERHKIERRIYEEHQARVACCQKYIDAITSKDFPINAERLVKNFFKISAKDAEGAYKTLTNNPATFSPIEINKIKPRFFGLIKVTPQDGIRINRLLGNFIKKLKR